MEKQITAARDLHRAHAIRAAKERICRDACRVQNTRDTTSNGVVFLSLSGAFFNFSLLPKTNSKKYPYVVKEVFLRSLTKYGWLWSLSIIKVYEGKNQIWI